MGNWLIFQYRRMMRWGDGEGYVEPGVGRPGLSV